MTDLTSSKAPLDADAIVDKLYDIAIDPQSLDSFMETWNDAGLDASAARKSIESFNEFDQAYRSHLKRAETFLHRDERSNLGLDFTEMLAPFDNLAAFIIDKSGIVVAGNDGATESFGIKTGTPCNQSDLPGDVQIALSEAIEDKSIRTSQTDRLLKFEMIDNRGTALFRMRSLEFSGDASAPYVLVVTTHYYWQAALGQTLKDTFDLTPAEQGIVRSLVEGQGAKTIAANRGTSEGTVRGQIKAVLAKMGARTQSEVIRLVLSLREISQSASGNDQRLPNQTTPVDGDWLEKEVWKPFGTLILPDGRKLDYLEMGPPTGMPVLLTHMGYSMARWTKPMVKLAFHHGLRVIVPMRAGYGYSENMHPKADVLATTRADTRAVLQHLGITRLPYIAQGGDLIFAMDFAAHHPEMVSEIGGLGARPSLPGDRHYSSMSKWHRFFLSTAKHAPHLLKFTTKAAATMCKRIGVTEMYHHMNKSSPADMALIDDPHTHAVLISNGELSASPTTDMSQAYAMELLVSENPWDDLMHKTKAIKTWFINGAEDPSTDIATIAEYREAYPWIEIEVVQNAGQLLIYSKFADVIPRIAAAAKAARA
ncbi:MAG: LuxR C-terminal-related transcriptional regulator [Pseudomonadota bacterium]